MLNSKFSPWPSFSEEEITAVQNVLASNRVNYWTGQQAKEFEFEFSLWSGCKKSVAVTNGTVALDLALKGLGIGAGDEVIVTPRTFIASVSSVVTAGAIPVFADVDSDSGNMSIETIKPVLNSRTKAIIPVHLAGWPCNMKEIMKLAEKHDIQVIEDCAQAHGAKIDGQPVGSFGHAGAWSFCQDKIMTTGGEGGMVTTNDDSLWSTMWSYKDHGKDWDAVYNREHAPGYRWLHEGFGTNWRMLEMQAAIGRIQLKRMESWSKRRTLIASKIYEVLQKHANILRVSVPDSGMTHAYYRLYAYVHPEGDYEVRRDRIVNEAQKMGTPIFQGSCSEVYLEKAFDSTNFRPKDRLPIARELGKTSLMFLTHPSLQDQEIDQYVNEIDGILSKF